MKRTSKTIALLSALALPLLGVGQSAQAAESKIFLKQSHGNTSIVLFDKSHHKAFGHRGHKLHQKFTPTHRKHRRSIRLGYKYPPANYGQNHWQHRNNAHFGNRLRGGHHQNIRFGKVLFGS